MKKVIIALLVVFCGVSAFCDASRVNAETVIYVKASGVGNGSSWQSALGDLQAALEMSQSGDEIWVAAGTYHPSDSDASVSFEMKDGVDLYGGFSGTETSLGERDWRLNKTILSGEIGDKSSKKDNSHHVVIAANAILDGFVVTAGNGTTGGGPPPVGGPPLRLGGSPAHAGEHSEGKPPAGGPPVGHLSPDMILQGGIGPGAGAGIVIWQVSPIIRNCQLIDNHAGKGGGFYIVGGGVGPFRQEGIEAYPTFINVTVKGNTAMGRGGGGSIDLGGKAIFIDCRFIDNECKTGKGGAIYNDFGCSPLFENCLFVNNRAESGGALGNDGESHPKFNNCTFYGNIAYEVGAALYQGSGPFNDPVVTNSIIWGNVCEEDLASVYDWNDCNSLISHSLVEGGFVGESIIDSDPLFINAENMNFSLQPESPGLTAGKNGSRIGFEQSYVGNRTEADLKAIRSNLDSIPYNDKPIILDLTNPVTSSVSVGGANTLYVKSGSTGDGRGWDSALGSLQEAIDQANFRYLSAGKTVQIWVGQGTYLPGTSRKDSFVLREGVEIYGGFKGGETALKQRDVKQNITVLSGDIGVKGDLSDNSYHIMIGANNVVLDGFTVTSGNADKLGGEVYDNKGGAILNYHGGKRIRPDLDLIGFSPLIRNCTFTNNHALEGGVIFTYHGGNPVFENCTFKDNSANYGGVAVDRGGTNSQYRNCIFENNKAKFKGGALFVDYGSMATLKSCTLNQNVSGTAGGAIYVIDRASQSIKNQTDFDLIDPSWKSLTDIFSSVLVLDSHFAKNRAGSNGGAIYLYEGSYALVKNTWFVANTAVANGGVIGAFNGSQGYMLGCTFDSNGPDSLYRGDERSTLKEIESSH